MNKLGITLEDLFNLSTAVIHNPDSYNAANYVSIDSRTIKKNSIYVAIKGERFDGHQFVKEAVRKGAGAVIIKQSKLKEFDSVNKTIITVKDTVKAYGELATVRRKKLGVKVISITGSNGKTSTKDMLGALLAEKYKIYKSVANNNNHIGVPLTILSANSNCEVLILEHGTNHFNEIKFTADIAQPDIALITNIGDSHLEYLSNREGVYKEKSALYDAALDNKGIILVNNDDPILKKETKKIKNKITYGFKGSPDVKGKILGYTDEGKTRIQVKYKNKSVEVTLPVIGEANAKNFLTACAVVLILGVTKKQIFTGVNNIQPAFKRLNVISKNDLMIIDDTYNSNPDSMKNAIDVLTKVKKYKRRVLITGDMLELGKEAEKYHKDLAQDVIKSKISDFYTIGKLMKHLADNIHGEIKRTKHFTLRKSLINFLRNEDFTDSVVMIKGSRGMKMDEFVEIIKQKAA